MFAGTIGIQRLLKLFDKYKIKATWFIPGHSLETFPDECAAVRDAGHEIGLHGYSHENPKDMTFEQQRDVLDKTWKLLTDFSGKPPRGSVAPWWEVSREGTELLLSYGVEYDQYVVLSPFFSFPGGVFLADGEEAPCRIRTTSATGCAPRISGLRLITRRRLRSG